MSSREAPGGPPGRHSAKDGSNEQRPRLSTKHKRRLTREPDPGEAESDVSFIVDAEDSSCRGEGAVTHLKSQHHSQADRAVPVQDKAEHKQKDLPSRCGHSGHKAGAENDQAHFKPAPRREESNPAPGRYPEVPELPDGSLDTILEGQEPEEKRSSYGARQGDKPKKGKQQDGQVSDSASSTRSSDNAQQEDSPGPLPRNGHREDPPPRTESRRNSVCLWEEDNPHLEMKQTKHVAAKESVPVPSRKQQNGTIAKDDNVKYGDARPTNMADMAKKVPHPERGAGLSRVACEEGCGKATAGSTVVEASHENRRRHNNEEVPHRREPEAPRACREHREEKETRRRAADLEEPKPAAQERAASKSALKPSKQQEIQVRVVPPPPREQGKSVKPVEGVKDSRSALPLPPTNKHRESPGPIHSFQDEESADEECVLKKYRRARGIKLPSAEDGETEVMTDTGNWSKLRDARNRGRARLDAAPRRPSEQIVKLNLDNQPEVEGLVWRVGPEDRGVWFKEFKENAPRPKDHDLVEGDELVEIDGKPVKGLPIDDIMEEWYRDMTNKAKQYLVLKLVPSTLPP